MGTRAGPCIVSTSTLSDCSLMVTLRFFALVPAGTRILTVRVVCWPDALSPSTQVSTSGHAPAAMPSLPSSVAMLPDATPGSVGAGGGGVGAGPAGASADAAVVAGLGGAAAGLADAATSLRWISASRAVRICSRADGPSAHLMAACAASSQSR